MWRRGRSRSTARWASRRSCRSASGSWSRSTWDWPTVPPRCTRSTWRRRCCAAPNRTTGCSRPTSCPPAAPRPASATPTSWPLSTTGRNPVPDLRITPDADTEELRSVVRTFLQRHCDTEAVFREFDGERGWDPAVWSRFAGELGAVALDVPEELGGAGASFREVAVVAEELGRSLVRLPWFSTAILGIGALLHADGDGADAARAELLPALASGEMTATLAHAEEAAGLGTRAEPDGAGWRLTGTKTRVIEGATADLILVSARTGTGLGLFAVAGGADGVTRLPQRTLDPNRPLATVRLQD